MLGTDHTGKTEFNLLLQVHHKVPMIKDRAGCEVLSCAPPQILRLGDLGAHRVNPWRNELRSEQSEAA